jgi:hypothetical protein
MGKLAYDFLKNPDRMFGPASPGRNVIASSKQLSVTHSKPLWARSATSALAVEVVQVLVGQAHSPRPEPRVAIGAELAIAAIRDGDGQVAGPEEGKEAQIRDVFEHVMIRRVSLDHGAINLLS